MNPSNLAQLQAGDRARVCCVHAQGAVRRRLQDIGVISDTVIECLQHSPSGDPTAYLIRGAVIALRADDAAKIEIESGV